MIVRATEAAEQTANAVADAIVRIGNEYFHWLAWPQIWPNSGRGTAKPGSIVMHAFCEAQTVIASGATEAVLVYHAGRHAYTVELPTEEFWSLCGARNLPDVQAWPAMRPALDRFTPSEEPA